MESSTSLFWSVLNYTKDKPFSTGQNVLLGICGLTTAITAVQYGFIWTLIFSAVPVVLGAVLFLLFSDESDGGIVVETRKLLSYVDMPIAKRIVARIPQPSAPVAHVDVVEPVHSSEGPKKLTSQSLELIYPWINLSIPQVLDSSLTNLFEIILNQYAIKDWYPRVQVRRNFATEARIGLRYIAARLVRKTMVPDYSDFFLNRVSKVVVDHVSVYLTLKSLANSSGEKDVDALLKQNEHLCHPAMKSESNEDLFYYNISAKLLGSIIPQEFRRFPASAAVLREVLSDMVLKIVVESFSEPHRLNFFVTLGLQPPAANPEQQSEEEPVDETNQTEVPFLKNFAPDEKIPSTIQRVPLKQILKETTLKNTFEQHLKALGLDDFYKIHESMEWINKFLESVVLGEAAKNSIYQSLLKLQHEIKVAQDKQYTFPQEFVRDLQLTVSGGVSSVPKLRNLPSWKSMYDELVCLMENTLVPGFQETRLYHHLLIPPTEEVSRKRIRRTHSTKPRPANPEALRTFGETVRGALKEVPPVIDSQDSEMFDDFDGSSEFVDDDFDDIDNENVISEDALGSTLRDLSYYDVTITRAERRRDDRGRIFMIFNIVVQDRGPLSPDNGKRWIVQRKYSEFYIIDSKIREFHGTLEAAGYLPAKKSWTAPSLEFLQQRLGDFEKFLQSLVHEPKLRYSMILYNFLATTIEFDSPIFPDLGLSKVMRTVPQMLTSERGQNVESFIRSLLSTALPGKPKPQNENIPIPDELVQPDGAFSILPRKPESVAFIPPKTTKPTEEFTGFQNVFSELMYLASTLLKVDPEMLGFVACCRSFAVPFVEEMARKEVKKVVDFIENPETLSFLTDLLCDILTTEYPPVDEVEIERRARAARELILDFARIPGADIFCRGNAEGVAALIFDLFQYKLLNKRLALILLDLIVTEIFPEVNVAKIND